MTHKTQCLPSFVNVIDRPGPDQQKLCDWSDITRYTLHIARYTLHVTHYTLHITHYTLHITFITGEHCLLTLWPRLLTASPIPD